MVDLPRPGKRLVAGPRVRPRMAVAFFAPEPGRGGDGGDWCALRTRGGSRRRDRPTCSDLEDGRPPIDRVVSLTRPPWSTLGRPDGRLRIGSTLPMRTLERDPHLRATFRASTTALRSVGSVPLRHRATVGGNLARGPHRPRTCCPILLALDALIDLIRSRRTPTVPLDAFPAFIAVGRPRAGELIEAVEVPEWRHARPSLATGPAGERHLPGGVAVARPAGRPRIGRSRSGGVVPKSLRVLRRRGAALGPSGPRSATSDTWPPRSRPGTRRSPPTAGRPKPIVVASSRSSCDGRFGAALGRQDAT